MMLVGGVVGNAYRVMFTLDDGSGGLKAGLVSGDFTCTIINIDDTASTTATVTESTQASGDYLFDVPGAFLTTHGPGNYKVQLVIAATGPKFDALWGPRLKVNFEDIDSLKNAMEGFWVLSS